MGAGNLVDRDREQAVLGETLRRLDEREGGIFLVAGEAGVGKTALVEAALCSTGVRVLRGAAHATGSQPYGPLRAALDAQLRTGPRPLDRVRPAAAEEAAEVAALSPAATEDTQSAIRQAFERLALHGPTLVFLDDLHWADAATIGVLHHWVTPLTDLPLLVVGAYRSDELPLAHSLRGLRAALRRATGGNHRHLTVSPLAPPDSERLARRVLGDGAAPELVAAVLRRAHGLPFYVEELAAATVGTRDASGAPAEGTVPESVRDVVAQRLAALAPPARALVELAAAAESPLPLDVLAEMGAEEAAVEEVFELGLLVEHPAQPDGSTHAAFRHALVAEAVYATTPWTRRRRHHAALARTLQARGTAPSVVAAHWSRAHEPERARPLFIAAARAACGDHAYRDAKASIEQALALWPAGEEEEARLEALDQLGVCAERCGEVAEAIRAWEQVAAARRSTGDQSSIADLLRRLAGAYELANDWPRALEARSLAAEAFTGAGLVADAAGERLAAAAHLQSAGDLTGALRLVDEAWASMKATPHGSAPGPVEAPGLRAHALALEGLIRTKFGDTAAGLELTRTALDLALGSGLDALVAEVYYLHADALEHAASYSAALDAWSDAFAFCRRRGLDSDAHVCLACLTPALRHTGQWDRALEVGREVLATDDAPELARMVAAGETGLILANRGRAVTARRHLARAAAFSIVCELFPLEVETRWGLARLDALDGNDDSAAGRLRELCVRCLDREERHYSVAALRWAASFFGPRGLSGDLGACTDALARIAAATGTAEATAAVAHALGEIALVDGDPRRAADQFDRALELLRGIAVPAEIAETRARAGVALAAAGKRDAAVERLVAAYHTARTLGAEPLAATAAEELQRLGEDVRRRLGRSAASGGTPRLTRREEEVLRLVAVGRTNREIARELFLSPRTVDMHVRNLMAKLGSRTRTEAVRQAGALHLLEAVPPAT